MDFLVFRTGVPFGYLILAMVFFIAFVVSCISLRRALKARPVNKLKALLPCMPIAFFALVVSANLNAGAVEWNPLIRGDAPLLGNWEEGASVLALHEGGQYACAGSACAALNAAGKWQRVGDFEIDFAPADGAPTRWRITAHEGRYEFVAGAVGDPDNWQTDVTFRKPVSPASAQ